MKLSELVANGTISFEELLLETSEIIERTKLVNDGLNACTKTLLFPLRVEQLDCFSCSDTSCGGYGSWGTVSRDGIFTCRNYYDDKEIGRVNLNNPTDVFIALESSAFACCLRKFLEQQIQKA